MVSDLLYEAFFVVGRVRAEWDFISSTSHIILYVLNYLYVTHLMLIFTKAEIVQARSSASNIVSDLSFSLLRDNSGNDLTCCQRDEIC